jgi:acetyl-CoA synthetase
MQATNHGASHTIWNPPEDWRSTTLLGELATRLDARDYDDLLGMSLNTPERYWAEVVQHLRFRWRQRPHALREAGDDAAFPAWFPGGELNLIDSIFQHAVGDLAQVPAILGEDEAGQVQSISFGELPGRVMAIASGLHRQGIAAGDRVGLMMPMNAQAVLSLLAIAALGAIAVPLFSGFGVEAAAARLRLAKARHLIAAAAFARRGRQIRLDGTLAGIREALPGLRLVIEGATQLTDVCAWNDLLLPGAPSLTEPRAMQATDPFMIVFTSGTTGKPKGTVHTHAGFPLKVLHDSAYHFDLRPGDRWLWPSDMGWIVGPITSLGGLMRGASLVCFDGAPDYPHPARLAQLIDRHGVTHFGASPTLVRSLAASENATSGAGLESLRLLILAGEVIDPEHFAWFFRVFGANRLPVINYTGGTEASGALLANVPVRPIKPCGFNSVSPGVDAFVAGEDGARLEEVVGELVVATPFVGMTKGFWDDPQRYREAYWTQRPGLWSHGDLVYQDGEGHFFVLGRADDTLKIAGKRVGPAEVEDLVLELAQVREVAAVGLLDPMKGQQLVLCVVPAGTDTMGLGEVIDAHVVQALGKPFRPAKIHLVAQLPKTRNGKIMRRVIRNVLQGDAPGDLSALENPDAIDLLQTLASSMNSRHGHPSSEAP